MPYIGTSPSQGVRRVHTYTATANQTSFSGAGAEGATLSYKDSNFVDVYQNGVKLGDADYTATSGTAIVLGTGATVSDLVVVVAYDVFSAADTVSKADGGQFDGNITMAGTLGVTGVLTGTSLDISGDIDIDGTTNLDVVDIDGAVDMASTLQVDGAITSSAGATITTADNSDNLTLTSTDADASSGPNLNMFRNSSSPADNDFLGNIKFNGRNDNSQDVQYAEIEIYSTDVSDGTEDGLYNVNVMTGGSNLSYMQLKAGSGAVFNEDSNDIDFRVESNSNTHMLFVDAGNERVGVGTTSPLSRFNVSQDISTGYDASNINNDAIMVMRLENSNTASDGQCMTKYRTGGGADGFFGLIQGSANSGDFVWLNQNSNSRNEQMRLKMDDQYLMIGTTTVDLSSVTSGSGITLGGNGGQIIMALESGNGQYINKTNYSSGTYNNMVFQVDTSVKGTISCDGTNTAYNTSSDYRLKENVSYTYDATTRIKQLKPARFNFIGKDRTQDGFLAHEVSSIVPEAVSGDKDGMEDIGTVTDKDGNVRYENVLEEKADTTNGETWTKTSSRELIQQLDQAKLVPLLTKALQEQQATIEALTARIVTLENA